MSQSMEQLAKVIVREDEVWMGEVKVYYDFTRREVVVEIYKGAGEKLLRTVKESLT